MVSKIQVSLEMNKMRHPLEAGKMERERTDDAPGVELPLVLWVGDGSETGT